jgi:DNA replication protein DnaC
MRLLKYCDLPARSEERTLETYDPGHYSGLKLALRAATALAEGSEEIKWLTLSGGRDLGKTHLAIAVCRRWLSRGTPAKYVFVPALLDWLREAIEQPALSLSSRMKILSEVPLLVLDDLGVQKPTEWAMERLMTIINHRYENGLPLMVTTNKSVENLPGDDEGRIGSRLKRFVPGKVVVMVGPEYVTRRKMQGGYSR